MNYQDNYKSVWDDAGCHYGTWDGFDTPYYWYFSAYGPDDRAFTVQIPCVDVATADGVKQAKADMNKLLAYRSEKTFNAQQ